MENKEKHLFLEFFCQIKIQLLDIDNPKETLDNTVYWTEVTTLVVRMPCPLGGGGGGTRIICCDLGKHLKLF
jgi:hypothetical protein